MMEHIDGSEMFNVSGPYDDSRIDLDFLGAAAQSIGAAVAFLVVIIGWAIHKIFGKDLLW
jgi:hypothetical protein